METIKYIICISCFCCLFSEFSGIMQWIKYLPQWFSTQEQRDKLFGEHPERFTKERGYQFIKRLKPFDCAKCLSFWMGLVLFSLRGDGILAIFYASICSVLSIYIVRYAK